jgi:hypothetical protein
MYYVVRVWDEDKLIYEQEFPPELKDNEKKAKKNYDHMVMLWPEYKVTYTSQAVSNLLL